MDHADKQMRGWKPIAQYLQVSVRTAMRWESTRDLPLRRLSGGPKDSVYAFRSELDAWMRSAETAHPETENPALHAGDERSAAALAQSVPPETITEGWPAGSRSRPRLIVLTGAVVVVSVCLVVAFAVTRQRPEPISSRAVWSRSPFPKSAGIETHVGAATGRRPVQLHLLRPDGLMAQITILDGEAGYVGSLEGAFGIVLRPKLMPPRLLLEMARADGKPVKAGAPGPFTLALEPETIVDVPLPFAFKVEWRRSPD
jgi:hypothetical protein